MSFWVYLCNSNSISMRFLSNFLYGTADLSCLCFPFSLLDLIFLFPCAQGLWVDWCQWLVKQTWPLTQIQGWLQWLGTGSKALPRSNSKLIAARKRRREPTIDGVWQCVLFLDLANYKLTRWCWIWIGNMIGLAARVLEKQLDWTCSCAHRIKKPARDNCQLIHLIKFHDFQTVQRSTTHETQYSSLGWNL